MILHLPPPVHGAATVGKYLAESKALNEQFDINYINLSTSVTISEVGKKGLNKITNLVKIQGRVLRALLTKKYQICYFTLTASGPGFYKDLMVVLILKLFRQKIIYHFHNKGVAANSGRRMNDLLYRFVFRNTKSILLSPNLYGDFKKYIDRKNVYFCANGIPELAGSTMQPVAINTSVNARGRILFLSNMNVEKGPFVLLEACRLLKEKGFDFECHFVGAWFGISEPAFTERINQSKLSQNVFVHGPKFNDAKKPFFISSDVFVLPTFNECFPLVLLEAMCFGLPVVSTTEGGIPDIVVNEKTGYIVKPKDAAALASKLEILLANADLRKAFGAAARARFETCFTIGAFEANMITILKDAIAN